MPIALKPTHGTLDGKQIALDSAEFRNLAPEVKARVVVDFGYGPVRPYRQLLETLDDQL